jgi:hypothetical protein
MPFYVSLIYIFTHWVLRNLGPLRTFRLVIFDFISAWSTYSRSEYSSNSPPPREFRDFNMRFHVSLIYIFIHLVLCKSSANPCIPIVNIWFCVSLIYRPTHWVFIQTSATPKFRDVNMQLNVSLIYMFTYWVFIQPSATPNIHTF